MHCYLGSSVNTYKPFKLILSFVLSQCVKYRVEWATGMTASVKLSVPTCSIPAWGSQIPRSLKKVLWSLLGKNSSLIKQPISKLSVNEHNQFLGT